jgi:uncharacterized protein (TIGR02217 family)
MSFIESPRFPDCIAFGAQGGPSFFTEIVAVASGHEQRSEVWQFARLRWDVGHVARPEDDMHQLISFFRAARGRLHGFRFKDWSDYEADAGGVGLIGSSGTGSGTPAAMQLYKRYMLAGEPYDLRKIVKPIAASFAVQRDGLAMPSGWTLDATLGLITFGADITRVVTAITNANPAVVTTSVAHGFADGETIWLSGVSGMVEVNELAFEIGSVTATTFALVGVNSTAYGTFTGTASASRYPQPAETLTWTGEYDVPCRFDTDDMKIQIVNRSGERLLEAWDAIPIVEIRIAEDTGNGEDGGGGALLGGFSMGFDEGFS